VTYASYTRNTQELIKKLAHGRRYRQAVEIISARDNDVVLDYGCGDGHLFTYLTNVPPSQLVGYDPDPKQLLDADPEIAASVTLSSSLAALREAFAGAFSLIVCMEVCEHLTQHALDELFETITFLAAPGARLVFGVPIETGPTGLMKNLYRILHGGRQGATIGRAIGSFLGRPIVRKVSDVEWYGSHIGFDDRSFRAQLEDRGYMLRREDFLPFPKLKRLLNNEIYYSCVARSSASPS